MFDFKSKNSTKVPSGQLPDRELVNLLCEGNNPVQLQLLQKIRPIVKFIRIKREAFDLDETDLTHDFYIFLQKNNFEKLRSFRFDSQLNTWLFAVCYRFISRQYETFMKEKKLKTTLIDGVKVCIIDETSQKYLVRAELLDAISKLTDKRECLVLILILQGYEAKEIAENLGTTVNNVYVIKSRAIEKLRKLLNE